MFCRVLSLVHQVLHQGLCHVCCQYPSVGIAAPTIMSPDQSYKPYCHVAWLVLSPSPLRHQVFVVVARYSVCVVHCTVIRSMAVYAVRSLPPRRPSCSLVLSHPLSLGLCCLSGLLSLCLMRLVFVINHVTWSITLPGLWRHRPPLFLCRLPHVPSGQTFVLVPGQLHRPVCSTRQLGCDAVRFGTRSCPWSHTNLVFLVICNVVVSSTATRVTKSSFVILCAPSIFCLPCVMSSPCLLCALHDVAVSPTAIDDSSVAVAAVSSITMLSLSSSLDAATVSTITFSRSSNNICLTHDHHRLLCRRLLHCCGVLVQCSISTAILDQRHPV